MPSTLDFGLDAMLRCYEGIEVRGKPLDGDVLLHYYTVRGLIAFFVQNEHRVYATEADARLLLWRLFKFNMTWGLLPICVLVYMPPLAILNYWIEKRSIRKQVRKARKEKTKIEMSR